MIVCRDLGSQRQARPKTIIEKPLKLNFKSANHAIELAGKFR